jgi:hypothetical protein
LKPSLTLPLQKSILRDAVSDLALHYLAKLKILLVKDIERDEIEFTCKTLQVKLCRSLKPRCAAVVDMSAVLPHCFGRRAAYC